jgi:hypothetical protein
MGGHVLSPDCQSGPCLVLLARWRHWLECLIVPSDNERVADEFGNEDRPVWARRIRSERIARGWSQAEAVEALRFHANSPLASNSSLLRNWKRWEAGDSAPDSFYKPILARTFGTVTAALFPDTGRGAADELLGAAGMGTLEILARLRASDVSLSTLEALVITVDRLSSDYAHVPAEQLLDEGRDWLRRLTGLRDGRLTLAQHRDVLVLAGRLALLVGCVEYDLGQAGPAEATRQAALSLGREAEDLDIVGWAHEMRSWYALTRGDYRTAINAAQSGLNAVGRRHSVAVQLAAHQAKAWARIGNRREVETALDCGRATLEALEYPENPNNHFVVDPSKWDFYTMDVYRHVGEDRLAEMHAHEVLRTSVGPDGNVSKPMRAAEAHVTLGVVAARAGDIESALAEGELALAGQRQSLPSLVLHTRELVDVLQARFPGATRVAEYLDLLHTLAPRS